MSQFQRDASISRYIEQVRAIPTLSREDEHELAIKAQAGDGAATNALVEANLRYVVAVALQYRRYGIRTSELIAEGNLGLMMAVRKFDPERGTRFVTYAGYWIRAYVLDLVVRANRMVGAGSGPLRSKLFFRLRRERARISNVVQDREAQIEHLAGEFDVTPQKMRSMLERLDAHDVSLDQQVFQDTGMSLVETMPGNEISQEMEVIHCEREEALNDKLGSAMQELDDRERFIVEHRLMADDSMSLAAIGRTLGVSRERARQLESRAKKKLRQQLEEFEPAVA